MSVSFSTQHANPEQGRRPPHVRGVRGGHMSNEAKIWLRLIGVGLPFLGMFIGCSTATSWHGDVASGVKGFGAIGAMFGLLLLALSFVPAPSEEDEQERSEPSAPTKRQQARDA